MLRESFDPAAIAASYERAGAACLSVLTDRPFFQGSPEYLVEARIACALPALRKEFIIDEYQVAESRALGADAILLIVAALDDARLAALTRARSGLFGWTCWSKSTTRELERALALETPLIGINNRNLRNFSVSLHTTLELLPDVPPDRARGHRKRHLRAARRRADAPARRARVPRRRGVHARARSGRRADGAVRLSALMSAIAVDEVSKHWTTADGQVHAVDGISFDFDPGTLNVLLGPSGCGKSTTLRLIAGLETADAGRILIGGRDVTDLPPAQRNIAMVFQSYALFPHLTVAENIVFGLHVRKVPPAERGGAARARGRPARAWRRCSRASRRSSPAASSSASRSAARSSPRRRCA